MTTQLHFPKAYHFHRLPGAIKQYPEDFVVIERLPEQPIGAGEHLWLLIEKTGQNTQWVAKQLAQWAGIPPRDVSFAGMKDRQAMTRQTFSLHLPGKETPDMASLEIPGVHVIEAARHTKKLKTGQLIGNHFSIRVRLDQPNALLIGEQWQLIITQGVPNYFGPQRFGQQGKNVNDGIAWLKGKKKLPRHLQGIYLSAVRSWLFNLLLADRVEQNNWCNLLPGDFVQFTEGKVGFYCESPSKQDIERVQQGSASPCASLIGRTRDTFTELDDRERAVLQDHQETIDALIKFGVDRHFRKMRLFIESPNIEFVGNDPVFSFFLPAGSFATAVMAEMFDLTVHTGYADWNE